MVGSVFAAQVAVAFSASRKSSMVAQTSVKSKTRQLAPLVVKQKRAVCVPGARTRARPTLNSCFRAC
jgi:hypothetical protein